MICQYCGCKADHVTGDVIYPHRQDLKRLKFYHCEPCDAYVGCHKTGGSLGTLANKELRAWRKLAHAAFDPLWLPLGIGFRHQAYKWASSVMGLKKSETHIAMFAIEQCKELIKHIEDYNKGQE